MMIQESLQKIEQVETRMNPFPGLRPFELHESYLFFGRDGQSEQLISKLARSRFLAVVGTSGSGKSSLVRAGLLPSLLTGFMNSAGSSWRMVIMRPGNDPIGNLARALNDPEVFGSEHGENRAIQVAITEATLRRGTMGLVDVVTQNIMPASENLLVLADQFEEIFRFAQTAKDPRYENDAAAFVKLLIEASRQTAVNIYVVLTMRSDYLGDCAQFQDLPEAINEAQYLIPRLTRDQRREAIEGPVAVAGGEITPRLVNRLLNDVGDNPDQLPILQHALMRTWDEWENKKPEHNSVHQGKAIDQCCYETIGGMAEALSLHADEAFNELPDERSRLICTKLFKCLTEKGADNREIRRPVTLGEACAIVEASEKEVIAVVEPFRKHGRTFLMPPAEFPLNTESLIDISHESLIRNWKRLRDWVEEEARSARIYRRLADTAELHEQGSAGLWRDPDLQLALDWREKNSPNQTWAQRYHPAFDLAKGFLEKSWAENQEMIKAEKERQARDLKRTRLFAGILGLAFLVSAGLAVYGLKQKDIADKQSVEALRLKDIANNQSGEALKQKDIADKQSVEALRLKDIAELKTKEAKANEDRAKISAELAREKAAEATRNLGELYQEKARFSLASADANDSAEDYLHGWIYSVAALNVAKEPLPETAGRLLQSDFRPGNQAISAQRAEELGKVSLISFRKPEEYIFSKSSDSSDESNGSIVFSGGKPAKRLVFVSNITSLATAPSGTQFVVGDKDGTLKLWNGPSERRRDENWPKIIDDKKKLVTALTFCPDRKDGIQRLAAGFADGKIRLIQLIGNDLKLEAEHTCPSEKCEAVQTLAFAPNDGLLAAGSADGIIRVFQTSSGKLQRLPGQIDNGKIGMGALAFWPGSKLLVSGHGNGTVRVWDRNSQSLVAVVRLHDDAIISATFDPDGQTLTTASKDGVIKRTALRPKIFEQEWEIKTLLDVTGPTETLKKLYRISREELGYDSSKEEPTPTSAISERALKYFNTGATPIFTKKDADQKKLLVRTRYPKDVGLLSFSGDQIVLIPDQVASSAAALFHKSDLREGFAIEFEYMICNSKQKDSRYIGDGLVFMFYKKREPYLTQAPPAGGDMGFIAGSGYGVRFDVYSSRQGLYLQGPTGELKRNQSPDISTGNQWRKVCIEASPKTMTSQCSRQAENFQGVRVFLEGEKALDWKGLLNTEFGGVGFGAGTGEGMAKMAIKKVRLKRDGSQSDLEFPFNRDKLQLASTSNLAQGALNYPEFSDGKVVLVPDNLYQAAAALFLEKSIPIPKDFSVEFEYSTKNESSSDPYTTGDGLVFMLLKDRDPYREGHLPVGEEKAFIKGTGYGIHFNIYNRRSIELRGPQGNLLQTSFVRSLPDIHSDGKWRKVRVEVSTVMKRIRVTYEGILVIDWVGELDTTFDGIGFGAATAAVAGDRGQAEHAIRHVVLKETEKRGNFMSTSKSGQ